ncbi:MAG: zinc ribbon domain-containing protein [Deltaproteobacteria bacterium]|nr:zinc ribbon domain-containing protein [Deltaproteobacteria bacterium]MBW2053451.1 zinc ribbon domain-containing protein [Deltaproteobacteria bacterium]MBW2142008.1 zinc ribbon domain-containing protein [Deltaproteobacteria bacterium]MBW2323879.1 zinc ribbon domain-containing protein [Deltaproteobacteria bacterium]
MPIYEYQCDGCEQIIEEIQKFSDSPLKKCPRCGGKVHKLMSLNTFHLKGSGWYATDYANKKGPGSTPKSSDSTPAEKTDTSTTTETKKET